MIVHDAPVKYTFEPPCSSALLEAIRNHKYVSGRLIIVQENNCFQVYVYDGINLLGNGTLEDICNEEFIGSKHGPIYLDADFNNIKEKIYRTAQI